MVYKSYEHYCYACRKTIRSMGLATHRSGKEHQENVKEFLDLLLSLDNNYFQHYFALSRLYYEIGEYKKASELILIAKKFMPEQEVAQNTYFLNYNIYLLMDKLKPLQ